jgi:hypothetical protein
LDELVIAQSDLMETEFSMTWKKEDVEKVAVLIARIFIKKQLDNVETSKVKYTALGIKKRIGDPTALLHSLLKERKCKKNVNVISEALIEQASDNQLINKLVRASVFISLEGNDPISTAKALGASRWSEVNVLLDASVVIPYLCSKLFKRTDSSLFETSVIAIERLKKLGCNFFIPNQYLKESASHLLVSLQYIPYSDFSEDLIYSHNAYISNYYRLKSQGVSIPSDLTKYLSIFSKSINSNIYDNNTKTRRIMQDLQAKLNDYDINFCQISNVTSNSKAIEKVYTYVLNENNASKSELLLKNDINAVSYICKKVVESNEHWILLTWDKIMIQVGQQIDNSGWIISPEIALDFTTTYRQRELTKLCSLSHNIAKSRDRIGVLSAKILDNIVTSINCEQLDWELQEKINNFKDNLLESINFTNPSYMDFLEKKTSIFIESLKDKIKECL